MGVFDFQKLDVYTTAQDMVVVVDAIVEGLPTGRGYMRDQLRRAANSVTSNIAEGAGEFAPSEKARFYRIARRSATEAASQLLLIERLELAPAEALVEALELLERVVSMLVRMAANAERRGRGAGPR